MSEWLKEHAWKLTPAALDSAIRLLDQGAPHTDRGDLAETGDRGLAKCNG